MGVGSMANETADSHALRSSERATHDSSSFGSEVGESRCESVNGYLF